MNIHSAAEPWATIRVRLDANTSFVTREHPNGFAQASDALNELGALLADDPNVGGVETRDAHTLPPLPDPELWVYTLPEGIEPLLDRLTRLAQALGIAVATDVEIHHDDAWRDRWKEFYRPLYFGARKLLLRPSWIARADDDPELELVLDPGRAFGTGQHETTRLCLDALCDEANLRAPRRILDLGCGSGILALAAARLFPHASIVATDIDAEATATTRENAEANELLHRVEIFTGSLHELPSDTPFDAVLANIRTTTLIELAGPLRQYTSVGARVWLSGILVEEADDVARAFAAAGFSCDRRQTLEDWCALTLRREHDG